MIFEISFQVLTSGLLIVFFGLLSVIYLHFLKRKMKFLHSFTLSLGLAFLSILSFYRFNPVLWFERVQTIIIDLLQTQEGIWSVLTMVFLTPPLIVTAQMVSNKLSRRNFRSFYHLIYGIIIVSLLLVNHSLAFTALSITVFLFITGEYLRLSDNSNFLTSTVGKSMDGAMKGEEIRGFSSTLFYILGTMIVVVFLNTQFALASILILAIGDTSIAQIGEKLGQHKFSFNPKKTLEGSLSMILFCFVILQLIGIGILPSIIVSLSATLFESLDVEISDNLILPLVTGIILLAI